jgi:hypothetical protein
MPRGIRDIEKRSFHRVVKSPNTIGSTKERHLKKNTDQARERADAAFKKEERAREGVEARQEYEASGKAMREKTARLKSLRLAKATEPETKS